MLWCLVTNILKLNLEKWEISKLSIYKGFIDLLKILVIISLLVR